MLPAELVWWKCGIRRRGLAEGMSGNLNIATEKYSKANGGNGGYGRPLVAVWRRRRSGSSGTAAANGGCYGGGTGGGTDGGAGGAVRIQRNSRR